MRSRREFLAASLAGAALAPAAMAGVRYRGVEIGVQSWSFKDRPLEAMLDACAALGIRSVEMWSGHVEPVRELRQQPAGREKLRQWRIREGVAAAAKARGQFARRGMRLNAFNLSIRNDFTGEEIEAAFEMTRALGVDKLTSSSNVSTARRIDPFARRYRIRVGFHNHANIKDDEFATPEDFRRGFEGFSEYLGVNLDTGHFTALGLDPLAYVRGHHRKLVTLHIKDRKKNNGPKVPLGQGDTPNGAIVRLLRDEGWEVPANIEYAYPAEDPAAEVRQHLNYLKQALDS